jgi:lipid-A-disaccharide synthase
VKYYLISGEASGDLHGSHLIAALKKQDAMGQFRAWGGDLMEEKGAKLVKHFRDLAYMGFWEVVSHLPTILKNISFCKQDILEYDPDVIIYIDYPGFNLRIAQWAKSKGFKNHYYISPQVWAWKENRVHKIKQCIDALYVILPFEKTFFEEKHQFKVHYVGHPLMDVIPNHPKNKTFLSSNLLEENKPLIALLPGSRMQEIKKMLPLFVEVAAKFPNHQFVIAAAPSIPPDYYHQLIETSPLKIIYGATYDLLQHSSAALVTSGTATLETALFKVPQLVCYRSSYLSYWIAKKILNLKYISLVNLIVDSKVVLELIQGECTPKRLEVELTSLLNSKNNSLNKGYQKILSLLGSAGTSEKTAHLIYTAISKK